VLSYAAGLYITTCARQKTSFNPAFVLLQRHNICFHAQLIKICRQCTILLACSHGGFGSGFVAQDSIGSRIVPFRMVAQPMRRQCSRILLARPPIEVTAELTLDTSAQRDLLLDLRACWTCQAELGSVTLHGDNLSTSRSTSDVDHENLVLCELSNLCLLSIGGLDTEQSPQQEIVDLNLRVYRW